ncbi:MAG: hypothetical protein HQL75_04285 [Magnetococcales bacterium]|nr:hypothetical protein [Magnetococcales bacterium]
MMYCKYVYDAGTTYANWASDLAQLLTGETSLSNLSSQCIVEKSELITTVPAGWTLHDDAPGGDYYVLKAPWADGQGYKYALVGSVYVSGNYLNHCIGYQTWDATTHTGGSPIYLSDNATYAQRFNLNGAGTLYLFSSSRFIMMLGVTASGLVGGSTYAGPSGIFEHTRAMPWCTADEGVPPWGWTNFAWSGGYGTGFVLARAKRRSTGSMEDSCYAALRIPGGGISDLNSGTSERSLTDPTTLSLQMYPLILTGFGMSEDSLGAVNGYHGNLSSLCDVWGVQTGWLNLEDTFTWNNRTFVCILNAGGVNIAVRKE